MSKLFLLFVLPLCMIAKVHYAKVEPFEHVVLKSAVSALVTEVDFASEGSVVSDRRVIHLDDKLDKIDLKDTQKSVLLLKKMHRINQEIEQSLKGTVKRQEGYYQRLNKLSTASKTQKDNAYNAFISAKTQYLGTQEKIVSLEKQIMDMKYKSARLKESIVKKSLILKKRYLYKLRVKEGDFVNPGSPLAEVADISRAKLVLFLTPQEVEEYRDKSLFLDDKETQYKINKVWRVADEQFISSYRAEIYIDAPEGSFSKLIKVELK